MSYINLSTFLNSDSLKRFCVKHIKRTYSSCSLRKGVFDPLCSHVGPSHKYFLDATNKYFIHIVPKANLDCIEAASQILRSSKDGNRFQQLFIPFVCCVYLLPVLTVLLNSKTAVWVSFTNLW